MKILFVCTGNTCRSPLMQAMFEEYVNEKGVEFEIDSAGLSCGYGENPSRHTTAIIEKRGLFFTHTSQPVNTQLLESCDIIITATDAHKQAIIPYGFKDKLFSFKDICGEELQDPYGMDMSAYEKVEKTIEDNLEKLHIFIISLDKK